MKMKLLEVESLFMPKIGMVSQCLFYNKLKPQRNPIPIFLRNFDPLLMIFP